MTQVARIGAVVAVVAAGVAVALIFLGGDSYQVKMRFQSASQLVKGNLVQVSGHAVGKVEEIRVTDDGQAEIVTTIDEEYAPLRRGTRAVVRIPSLSGVANRYVDLQMGPMTAEAIPDGATLPASQTESAVDLDQLFQVFDPKTRKAFRISVEGFADMTEGKTKEARAAIRYLNPVMSASSRLFSELSRNDRHLERFIVETSRLVTDVADKREDLAGIVSNFGTVSTALANRDQELARAINLLPGFLRKANTTFVNLRATLDDLDPLVDASKPVVRELRPLMADLRPFADDAAPAFRDLARTIRRRGDDNDLVELMRAQPPLAEAALDEVEVNGETRQAAFPALADSLSGATPQLAFQRPYGVDLTGWFDDFSTSGAYDALGSFSRAGLAFSAFTFTPGLGQLVPVPPELRDEALTAGAVIGRNNRCPGSIERGALWYPEPGYGCDPTSRPIGP